ncbi:MAG: CHAT domain-containing protein [Chloroflexi bacterium]|jgi:hypothetical protein|nr:CHAT domain-containing protein [Chloroflexota bacterium]
MDYLSFDLRLGEWNTVTRAGIAEILYSPAGESERYPFVLDVELDDCCRRAQRTPAMAEELGRKLASSVFSQESLTLLHESYHIARERGRRLRLRLHVDSWELARLPWELMYDTRRGDFFVFDPMFSLVRYLRLHAAPPTLRQSDTLKIMAVAAAPHDLPRLAWERELDVLRDALNELADTHKIEITYCEHATQEKLHVALLESTPDVIHYIGHAAYDEQQRTGKLYLENEDGTSAPMNAREAARMFKRYRASLIVLNACETASGVWAGLAPSLMRAEIPAVVAMQWPVEDQAAIRFSHLFYRALSLGRPLDECVAEGRIGASAVSCDPNDWAAPVLFLRSPSGTLWVNDLGNLRGRLADVPAEQVVRGATRLPSAAPPREEEVHFKTRGPLLPASDADLIVDRPELRRALRLAQQPSVTQYLAVLSPRQAGKTTFLFRLMQLLQDFNSCVFVDLSVLRAQDARACFRYVAFRLVSELRGLLSGAALASEMPQINGSVEFLEFLRGLAEVVALPRIIIALDEVGALAPEVSDSFFNTLRTVFTQGRGMNSALSKYLFVFSGAVDLYGLTFGTNSPLNICEKLYLSDFSPSDVRRIVEQFARLQVEVEPQAPDRIYELAGGHPYLTMRLCALLERAQVERVTVQAVDAAAEELLVEDDNIRHVIHELERRPAERRRLRSVLMEGQSVPFSRNDPLLASLEMIGVIRPTQPVQIRNPLYERALRQYYAQAHDIDASPGHSAAGGDVEIEAMYERLAVLWADAVGPEGAYQSGKAWENLAAALFSLVPAFSIYPKLDPSIERQHILLAVHAQRGRDSYWGTYEPFALVACEDITDPSFYAHIAGMARVYGTRIAFVMPSNPADVETCNRYSGTYEQVVVLVLAKSEVERLLRERRSLDTFLRTRILDARLRRL